jgi:hypothetical protein
VHKDFLGNKRKPGRNQEKTTVEARKEVLAIADSPSLLSGRLGATLAPARAMIAQRRTVALYSALLVRNRIETKQDRISISVHRSP